VQERESISRTSGTNTSRQSSPANDPGEAPLKGGLLVAPDMARAISCYTGLVFFPAASGGRARAYGVTPTWFRWGMKPPDGQGTAVRRVQRPNRRRFHASRIPVSAPVCAPWRGVYLFVFGCFVLLAVVLLTMLTMIFPMNHYKSPYKTLSHVGQVCSAGSWFQCGILQSLRLSMNLLDYVVLLARCWHHRVYGMVAHARPPQPRQYTSEQRRLALVLWPLCHGHAGQRHHVPLDTGPGFASGLGFIQIISACPSRLIIIARCLLPIYRRLNVITPTEYLRPAFSRP